ncbi:unnamed protein product [Linum trigynum]|uniref:Uncharacterized protein n=1 Tax=Linum trigynum TaxID=586398 RepID=A0AAV2FLE1_9ROSI
MARATPSTAFFLCIAAALLILSVVADARYDLPDFQDFRFKDPTTTSDGDPVCNGQVGSQSLHRPPPTEREARRRARRRSSLRFGEGDGGREEEDGGGGSLDGS